METGKLGLVSAPVHISSVAAPTEKRMDVQAPLTAVYIHTVPALPVQPYQPQLPATARETPTIHLAMPPMYSKETLPFLTLHIAGGLQSPPGLGLTAAPPASKPKSAGKHVCPHCGRDCMKPSVLEKHLRCHTGERPYPCTTCGVSFKTQSNLYKHKRTQAHARLSSESEQSSLGSLDSVSSSRETHTSSLSLDECSEELGSMDATLPAAEITCQPNTSKVNSTKSQGSVSEQNELTSTGHKTEVNESAKEEEIMKVDNEKPALTVSRHLRRQEATLSSKNWENSVSTDSGFSESSDHYPSPGSVLPDHSMDSLTESNKEHLEESSASTHKPSDPGHSAQETKDTVREQEQRKLEERISKIISENTAVVEDKQLENVRPRKTVLSKQGSIDLPMPYTYKDSFHFDMRISKTQNVGLQRNRKPGLYSSVPTQQSTTMEHAPLTRSNSLPFSVTLLQPEKRSPTPSYQSDYVTLIRRGSSGQINPTGFTIKPVNQQSSTHRPLVRQTAVDCNHATDSLFMNSSVEESYDGDGGDICGEPSNRKFRRKKAQKFAYNKWYMYGGGTFKKLYNAEKSVDNSVNKGRKCVTTEHEVVQGPQKRLSVVYKETVTSTTTITSSSATVCHPGCPPANLPLISAVDLNLRPSQPHSSCSPLKPPLRRNLSLSVLPLPSIGSLVSIKTNSLSSTEALTKHTDSLTSQFCGAHVPSDRKKQRTDEIEMETDPNTLTHPPPTSAPQQDTNLTNINLQQHQKHNQLKGIPIFPCISNANAPSVSTLPATSVPSAANASFLPKYQLKLPSAAESVSNVSPQVVDKPTGTTDCTLTSALSTEKTSSSATTFERTSSDPVTAPSMQTCDKTYDIKKMNTFNSTQAKLVSACTATSVCRAQTSRLSENATCSPTMVHSQFAATTITTSSLHDYHAGLCSTVIQPSKSAASPAVLHLPRTVAPVVANLPVITTARNPSSATALTVFSEGLLNSDHPLSQSQPQSASDHLNPANKTNASTNVTNTPCHVVPFEQLQPAAQNVFHVQTADLQICFQIISDEQLALIEPQIEGRAGTGLSQRQDTEAPEVVQSKTPNSVSMERSNKHEQFESLPVLNSESIKPPQSVHFVKPQTNVYMTEHSNSTQAECKPPEAPGLMLHPHKYSHVNMATESLSCVADVMSTAASLRCVQSGNVQTSEEQQTPSWNHCAEEQLSVVEGISQGGALSQTLPSQHKLNLTCVSPNAVDQSSTRSELLDNECQQKLQNEGALCDAGIMKANNDVAVYKSIRLESGETHPSLQLSLSEASGACANELSESVSINKCKTLGQSTQHACNPSEPTLSETQHSSKHANKGCDRVGPLNSCVPLQEIASSESHNVISSAHSEKQLHQFISASLNVQVERTKDATVVLNAPSAGLIEAEQRESQTWAHGSNSEQKNSIDCGLKTSPEAGETNQQRMCGHGGGGGTMIKDKNEGIKTDQESTSRYTVLPDMTNSEGENRDVKENPTTTSWLSEKHLQAQSGMSEYPPQSPQQAPSTSNLNLPDSSQTNFFHSPQPPLEMNNFYFSQQQWEKSYGHNQQTQVLCESNSSQFIKTQAQDQKQDQKQTQGNTTVGNNSPAVSCCTEPTTGSQKSQSFNSHHCQLSHSLQDNTAAGWSANTQASNSVMLDENPGPPLKPFTYPETEHDTKDQPPDDFTTQSSNSGRPDITNKYPSFFLSGQLHGYQPAECLTAGVRPVQSCQDYPEDTSSSDDEGKLIIEL